MNDNETGFVGEVRYARELGTHQAINLGLRVGLAVVAFVLLGPLVRVSGLGAPLALILGLLLWLPTALSYMELASSSAESGLYELVAQRQSAMIAFLAAWLLLLADLLTIRLLAEQGARLLTPWVEGYLSSPNRPLPATWLLPLLLGLGVLVALLRRRPWRQTDDMVLLGGMVATVLVAVVAVLGKGERAAAMKLAPLTFRGVASGALLVAVALLAVEAVGEWKAELRRPGPTMRQAITVTLSVLTLAALVLLFAALQLNAAHLTAAGLGGLLSHWDLLIGGPAIGLLFLVLIVMGISSLLLQSNRLFRQLSREGYLPGLSAVRNRRWRAITSIVGLALLSTAAISLPAQVAFAALVGLLLPYALVINASAVLVRPEEQEGGRVSPFLLPFPPLVPGLGLAITVFLALNAEPATLLAAASALVLGGLLYLIYGRTGHRRAQEARTVFRPRPRQPEIPGQPDRFRVLVPLLGTPAERRELLHLASALAKTADGEVLALQVISIPPQQTRAEGARLARESNQLLQWSLAQSEEGVPLLPLTRIGRDPVGTIIDTAREEHCDLILITWRPTSEPEATTLSATTVQQRQLVSDLVRGAPCMVAALDGSLAAEIKRILVPTAGGPNAPLAARLALDLARIWRAQVVGLTVLREEENHDAEAQARQWIAATFAGLPDAEEVEAQLVRSKRPVAEALIAEANRNYDLVILGASNESLLDRFLFGDIPQQVAEGTTTAAIMVRAARPAREAWLRFWWDRLQNAIPQLETEEQIALYRSLRRGARPSVNYFVMIVLSALIATLGLWQNSGAVIIGAMLVAPLMTPILATSLGVIMGDARMIRVAIEATLKGIAASMVVALFVTVILPQQAPGGEILARTRPTILDLFIALASGAAGAYAVARKEVSAALPGVAIAAALMPPLCAAGIGLASFQGAIAGGAMLLFSTNLVAINVAGGLVFLLLGMRPRRREVSREAQFRRGLLIALILLLIISLPLSWLGLRSAEQSRNQRLVSSWLSTAVAATGEAELLDFQVSRHDHTLQVHARILSTSDTIQESAVEAWSELLARKAGRPIHLTVDVQRVTRLESKGP